MKNKVVNAVLGISVAASVGAGGYLYAEGQTLSSELTQAKTDLNNVKETVEKNDADISAASSKLDELNKKNEETESYIDDLYEKMETVTFVEGYVIEPVDDLTMYATQDTNIRIGPSTDYKKAGEIGEGQELKIIGQVTSPDGKLWYVIQTDEESSIVTGENDTNILPEGKNHHMVSSSLLQDSKPQAKPKKSDKASSSSSSSSSSASSQPAQPAPAKPSCDNSCNCHSCDCDSCDCDVPACDSCHLNTYVPDDCGSINWGDGVTFE